MSYQEACSSSSVLSSIIDAPPPLSLTIKPQRQNQSKDASSHSKTSLDPLPRARKRPVPKPPATEKGKRKPIDRRIHNASERVRREILNHKFQELGDLLPSLKHVDKPSKPLIVTSALSFVTEAFRCESSYRNGMQALSKENEMLLTMLNQERQKSGLEPITLGTQAVMPRSLSEFELGLEPRSEGDEQQSQGDGDGEEELASSISSRSDLSESYCSRGNGASSWDGSHSHFTSCMTTPTRSDFPYQNYQQQGFSSTFPDLDTPITGQFYSGFEPEELNHIATYRRSTIGIPPQYYHSQQQHYHNHH